MQIFLERRDIQTRTVFTGNILRQPAMKNVNSRVSDEGYPVADDVMRGGILLACHHGLTPEQLDHIHTSFCEFAGSFSAKAKRRVPLQASAAGI